MQTRSQTYINGEWVTAHGQPRAVINPATEAVIATVQDSDASDVERAVRAARQAFDSWSRTRAEERARYIAALCDKLEARKAEFAATITAEMGMPLNLSLGWQVEGPISGLRAYVERAKLMEAEKQEGHSLIVQEPVGVCAFITPWNVPLHQLVGKVGPALAAGCTMILKPSEITPLHAYLFAEVCHEVGLPAGVFNLVIGDGPGVGEPLVTHPDVDMVSFTGSTRAGVRIAQLAAPGVKRVCQELGGKSPFIITEDADLSAAIEYGVKDVMVNSGQICCALTRMLVPQKRYQEAVALAKQAAESIVVGDPLDERSFMGPLSSAMQKERVQEYIRKGIEEGATLVTGGTDAPAGLERGYYLKPTLFADVNNDMTIAREEIFGPVLSMIPYQDEEEAIRIANDTPYGLSAAVWAGEREHAKAIARRLRAGQVNINGGGWNYVAPFGGYKQSGNGREWGDEGLSEFIEVKSMQL